MQRSQDERINLGELKGHIVKKIGVERSKRYFYHLSRFLSQKLTKSEFDKTCSRLLGRENLSLHNRLIRSILRNATVSSKSPLPAHLTTKPVANGPEQRESLAPNHSDHVCSNGVRSGVRKRKMRDSPVEQPACRLGGAADEIDGEFLRPVAKPRIPLCKEQEEQVRVALSASPLVAPIGIQFCSAGGSRRRRVPVSTSADAMSSYESGGLAETEVLRKRMESIAVAQGLEGVSTECANTLNAMLDVYLKKLIRSCVDLVGGRSTDGRGQGLFKKQQSQKSVQIQTPVRRQDEQHSAVTLLDFRTAMELNPHQLGENWPTLVERISIQVFREEH
ncbi:hypothetical protein Bca4012_096103 [Brassica carinata]|uniref:Transcriptional regulator of RNA polII, SAGA, subunit n=4 Tax=Brassica TaxID=3705 RepID=A0A0D3DVM4_BRAOL|nr:PREDICTED: uncharacterized protein LOC106308300 [Brassica oleracea var. oleracea]XP_013600907.1 PREDICTED: uncharacterized protein LOC106308300 [Brassica oleracea var. oleracea]XP_013600908.1 PREDICTED: uncharacterized protein LOC106308300 [Brassica oleracea var. oleracea]XP_013660730.2 uncharacterized protein LOC106365787 [Brassica napus]XP_048620975.1 uncharacterized protein LOC106365787 [Brassica napus]XP_048620976.1 uncharacterized protein LOC106365787 [Brassica napus]KAG2259101.1 hypo